MPEITVKTQSRIITQLPDQVDQSAELLFFPLAHGLDAAIADVLAVMPTGDANGLCLDQLALASPTILKQVYAGLLTVDPLRDMCRVFQSLAELGVGGVCNLPSTAVFEGVFGRAMDSSDVSFRLELEAFRDAFASIDGRKLDTRIFCYSLAQGLMAIESGLRQIVLHPGDGIGKSDNYVTSISASLNEMARQLKLAGAEQVLVYSHPTIKERLTLSTEVIDGKVVFDGR